MATTEAKSSQPLDDMATSLVEQLHEEAALLDQLTAEYGRETHLWTTGLTQRAQSYSLCLRQAKDLRGLQQSGKTLASRNGRLIRGNGNLIIGRSGEPVVTHPEVGDLVMRLGPSPTKLTAEEKELWRTHQVEVKEFAGTLGDPLKLKVLLEAADALKPEPIFKTDGTTPEMASWRPSSDYGSSRKQARGVKVRNEEVLAFFNRYLGPGREVEFVLLEIVSTNWGTGSRSYLIRGIRLDMHVPEGDRADRTSPKEMIEQLHKDAEELKRIAQRTHEFTLKRKRVAETEGAWKYPRLSFLSAEQQGITETVAEAKKVAKKRAKKVAVAAITMEVDDQAGAQ
jgi:hypothetical protein